MGTRAVKDRSRTSIDIRKDPLGGATVREERLNAGKLDVRKLKAVPRANSVRKGSIGASELGPVTRRFGGPVTVANGATTKADSGCRKGELVLGGGGRWTPPGAGRVDPVELRRFRFGVDGDRLQRKRGATTAPGLRHLPGAVKGPNQRRRPALWSWCDPKPGRRPTIAMELMGRLSIP